MHCCEGKTKGSLSREVITVMVKAMEKNYNCIDLMKFICPILVISIHIHPFGNTDNAILTYLNDFSQYVARLAVPYFFMASGYSFLRI